MFNFASYRLMAEFLFGFLFDENVLCTNERIPDEYNYKT